VDAEGEQVGIVSRYDALERAQIAGLDLVEISPTSSPPVCRIMDFGKFSFQKNKQRAAAKKKQKRVQIKEIKLRPVTEEGDYQVKLKSLIRFLSEGDKVKVTVRFRGREISHHELGMKILLRMENDLAEFGCIEQKPKLEGRQMVMTLGPGKKKASV
jgi:translation initiation factor IF-3